MPDSWGIFSKSYSGGHTSLLSPWGGSPCGPGKREKDLQPSLTRLRAKRSRGCRRPALWRPRAAARCSLGSAHSDCRMAGRSPGRVSHRWGRSHRGQGSQQQLRASPRPKFFLNLQRKASSSATNDCQRSGVGVRALSRL